MVAHGSSALTQDGYFISNEEVAPGVHDNFCEDLWSSLFLLKSAVDDGDRLQSDGECLPESEELQIDLWELDIELLEIGHVVTEELLKEVWLDKLTLKRLFSAPHQRLVRVEPDLVLLDVRVNQHHALNLIFNAVADKVIFEDQLLPEDEAEVRLAQQLIEEAVIFADQVVENVLEDGADLGEGEHVVLAMTLRLLVVLGMVSQVLHRHSVREGILWVSEGWEGEVALLNDEFKVVSARLLIEDELLLPTDTEPIDQLQTALHQNQVLSSLISIFNMRELLPEHSDNTDDQVNAALKSLDAGELRDLALRVEVLNPASQVLQHAQEFVHFDQVCSEFVDLVELVDEGHDLREVDQVRDAEALLLQKSAGCPVTAQVTDYSGSALLKHVLEEVNHLVLEDQLLPHLRWQATAVGSHRVLGCLNLSILH